MTTTAAAWLCRIGIHRWRRQRGGFIYHLDGSTQHGIGGGTRCSRCDKDKAR